MNRTPDRWIKVVDADNKLPVSRLPLIYRKFSPFGIVIREVLTSFPYYTDSEGNAQVPSNVTIQPGPGTRYVVDRRSNIGKTAEEIESNDVVYVRTLEMHQKEMSEPQR